MGSVRLPPEKVQLVSGRPDFFVTSAEIIISITRRCSAVRPKPDVQNGNYRFATFNGRVPHMPLLVHATPKYRHHRPSGKAVVVLQGKMHYLGPCGSQESRAAYDRLIAEWLAKGRAPNSQPKPTQITVAELILAYWGFATRHYVKNGVPTAEQPPSTIHDLKVLIGPVLMIAGLMVIYSTVAGSYGDLSRAGFLGLVAIAGALFGAGIGMYTKLPWYFLALVFAILFQPVGFVWKILHMLDAMGYHGQ